MYIETEETTARYIVATAIESDCIDITFFNAGVDTAYINNFPLTTNGSKSIKCNAGEILKSIYNLTFAGASPDQQVYVMRRCYK